ncbi:hypothetical protein M431DRAFT_477859 [Trichoderma harzianum CBS 226.95]|uniref:Nephrocystin 3-like N-terminal domain-containing protein n=1 Tax=Trichoderma harzianum CBS 226.95 TaxID=983964 RepID=A0A2T4ANM0_TRIHA|nr:hypothetical protein M431DRAFT_477859 [Trichoderma harzianum CBS 226.95]PTB58675.1 hypothetical protein M431DRAFT_477859 [Trichoderma harzianum CBS 226.95]
MANFTHSVITGNSIGHNSNIHQGDTIINVPQGNLQISSYPGTGQLNLEYVPASFDDASKQHLSMCLPHTREQILSDIRAWIDGNSEKGIYWLNGMAGTGKTTISLTIAHEYHQKKRLGASFFFSRGGGDLASAKKFAATISVQLAEQSPELRQLILNAATLNPRIGHLNLYNQWEKLVLEPLGLLESNSVQQPLLIVVDALDECDDEKDIGTLIECFASTIANVKEIPIRIFITSRPELPIHLTLSRVSINLRQHFALHSIEQAIVDGDLRIYYQYHLTQLSQRYVWDKRIILDNAIRTLVEKTHGLFIYAATACRFIKEGGINSEKRMLSLSAPGPSASEAEKELDGIYTTVLETSFRTELSSKEAIELQPEFQKIVGSVMVLFDTLALTDLVDVINGEKERVESMINNLRSVLDISEDERRHISILHPSFRDFLLNPGRCSHNTFKIPAKQLHYDLFERCLAIMHGSLPKNICKLRSPAAKARDITKDQVDTCISFPIQYACRYWIQHLQSSGRNWMNHGGMKDFFWTDFLGWLEVLSLLGRLSEGINLLAGLQSWLHDTSKKKNFQLSLQSQWKKINLFPKSKASDAVNTNHASDTSQSLGMLIHDAKRFAFQHSGIIEETPLQIYCSALIFSPEQSLIRQLYHTEIPSWIIPSFKRHSTWPRYTQALWHPQPVWSLAFSPDGSYLASGYHDGAIWLWDAVTGAKQRMLEGHGSGVRSIDFSPKEELIASGSEDSTIRLWNSTTGATRGILTLGIDIIFQVAFSPDGASLASFSTDSNHYTVCMWNIASHAKQWTFKYDDGRVHISFLSDGTHVAYSSSSVTGLLDSNTGKSVCILAEYGGKICSSRLASSRQMVGVRTYTQIMLFDIQPSARRRWQSKSELDYHIKLITFSPDDRVLAAHVKGRIELLDTTSGHKTHTISCDTYMEEFAFSADGTFIASFSYENKIRFWDLSVGRQQSATDFDFLEWYITIKSSCARFVALLTKPSKRITGLYESQLFIWDAQEMMMKKNFRVTGKAKILSMTFSPNSQFIAICWHNNVVDLFEWESGENILTNIEANNIIVYIEVSRFSPDGNFLAIYTPHHDTQIWDIRRRTVVHKFQSRYSKVAFSQDSKRIVYLLTSEKLSMFDLGTCDHLAQIEVGMGRLCHWSFDSNNRLVLFYSASSSGPSQRQLRGAHTELISRVIQLPSSISLLKPVPATNIVITRWDGRCEIWDLTTGTVMGSFENAGELAYSQLLPCKAHLRIDEAIVPVSKPDSLGCCSHRLSLESLWIKRGNDKLVYIPPEYASALITVGCKGVLFQPFKESRWNIFRSNSEPINTLEFDFSGIEDRYI